LIALSLSLLPIATIEAVTDEWTVSTVDEDLFYASYRFEGVDMAYLQGNDMQIRSWFWFEGPVLDWGRYVTEAYLEVTTPTTALTDPDAYMFIYGIPSMKGGTPSNAEDPSFINGPYTTNLYQVNLSSFVGSYVKHNITVTRIIREINQGHYFWDGHDIAFATLSPAREEAEERSVATIEAGYPAKLYIHYGVGPVDPTSQGAVWVNNTNGLDIYQYQVYENFYEDWTEVDPLNLIGTSALNPYRITFHDFGYEEYWDDLTYFNRDDLLSNTADYIEIRFKATLTDEEVPYHRPDFNWIQLSGGGYSVQLQHYVGGAGADEDHYFNLGADVMTYGQDTCVFNDPIPPTRQGWFAFLWDYEQKEICVRQYSTEPNSSAAWYNDFIFEDNATGIDIDLIHWTGVRFTSRLGSNFYNGLNWGYLENMLILVDFVPLYNGTFFVVDPETNETVVDDMPDLDSVIDWIETNYPDPEDPAPGEAWEESPVSRFSFKLILFVIGMILFMGTPIYGFAVKPETATWIAIMFTMFCGVALLWSLQLM